LKQALGSPEIRREKTLAGGARCALRKVNTGKVAARIGKRYITYFAPDSGTLTLIKPVNAGNARLFDAGSKLTATKFCQRFRHDPAPRFPSGMETGWLQRKPVISTSIASTQIEIAKAVTQSKAPDID
jgi:hypothetical protein